MIGGAVNGVGETGCAGRSSSPTKHYVMTLLHMLEDKSICWFLRQVHYLELVSPG